MKKKVLSLLLTGSIMATLLSACGAKDAGGSQVSDSGESQTAEQAVEREPGEVEEGGQKVKLTALISKSGLTKDVNELKWLSEIEDKTGVDIE